MSLFGTQGTTVVLRHGKDFEVIAENKLDGQFDGSMALVEDELYLRSWTHLYRNEE